MTARRRRQKSYATGEAAGQARQDQNGVWRRMRPLRRVVSGLAIVLLPVLLLAAIATGIVYVRLTNGPVSVSYLKPAIERRIAERLGGFDVSLSDVVLSLAEGSGAFQLTDIKVTDQAGNLVAQAPLASMQIDRSRLLRGQVVPSGIILIRPQMQLSYSATDGLSLSFARRAAAADGALASGAVVADAASGQRTPASAANDRPLVYDERAARITVLGKIADLLGKMRTGQASALSFDKIGVRNALIDLDYNGRRSRWGIPSGDIEIKHLDGRSVVSGLATVAEAEGQNVVLALQAETAAETRAITLRTSVRDLPPSSVARILPAFAGLSGIDAPLSAEAMFKLAETGEVAAGTVTVEVGAGRFAAIAGVSPVALDHGRIAIRFDKGSPLINVEPSTLSWGGGNEIVLGGTIARSAAPDGGDSSGGWQFDLEAQSGHFISHAGSAVRRPIERWSVAGSVDPESGALEIKEAVVAAAGGSLLMKGQITTGRAIRYRLGGRIGPTPVAALAFLWPSGMAPAAHAWTRDNVVGGQVTGGHFALALTDTSYTQSLVLQARDVQLRPVIGKQPLYAEKALLRLRGNALEITAPLAKKRLAKSRELTLKQIRFDVPDVMVDQPLGSLTFSVSSDVQGALAVLAVSPRSSLLPAGLLDMADKKAVGLLEGRLNVAVPLSEQSGVEPVITGVLKIRDLRVKQIVGQHDISGGAIDLNLATRSINADGEMLLAGVATKVTGQFILDAPLESQPPLRLQMKLDEADRDKLGIKINHIVRGIVKVDANLIPRTGGGLGSKVRADLTGAAIAIDSLAWVKPTGRQTQLEFDLVPGEQHPVLLDNLRVVGDGIAIQGRAMLNAQYELRAFDLPVFSIDRVTRLKIAGRLHGKRVWKVIASGQTFEGRALFRSLFDAGRTSRGPKIPAAKQMGIDLEADINTVLGFWNSRMSNVRVTLSKRKGKTQDLRLEGRLAGNKVLRARVTRGRKNARELHAFSDDAGKAFRLVGFYPNVQDGRLELVVNLDGEGQADKAGVLLVRKFKILDDQVVGELARAPRGGIRRRRAAAQANNQALAFDWMRLPFVVGNGQFILQGAELRGPVVGATVEGKADFVARSVDLSGTYVPLQGLNGALGVIPGLGQIIAGPRGEGVLGMKFAVRGPMGRPEMLVNPLSIMAPGIFREIFQISNPSLEVTKRAAPAPARGGRPQPSPGRPPKWRRGVFGSQN